MDASDEEDHPTSGSSSSSRIPSKDAVDKWNDVLNLGRIPVKPTFGPSAVKATKRWGGASSGPFRAPQQDPCLLQAFEKAKTANKSLVDSSAAIASSSGAAAHAIITATETLESCIAEFEKIQSSQVGGWKDFFLNVVSCLKTDALAPLDDALTLQASSYGRSIATVRNGVIAAADAPAKAVLKVVPPTEEFFFGDPAERLTSTMGYALMSAQLRQASSSSSSRGKRGGSSSSSSLSRAAAARAAITASASKKSVPSSSSSSSHPFPRGRGGKGKK